MKKLIYISILLGFISLSAQDKGSNVLNKIYKNLEYNTIAYDALKEKWLLKDPVLVREIFNRFLVKNKITIDNQYPGRTVLFNMSKELDEKNIVILIKKRYYDDEIESLTFLPYKNLQYDTLVTDFIDPVDGWYYIRDIIGQVMYDKMKDKSYFWGGLTTERFHNREGYNFDLKLSLMNSNISLWSLTTSEFNKYQLSLAGKWGMPHLFNTGWFANEYFAGLELKYFTSVSNNPNEFNYLFRVFTSFETKYPFSEGYNKTLKLYNHVAADIIYRPSVNPDNFFSNTYLSLSMVAGLAKDNNTPRNNNFSVNQRLYSIENNASFTAIQKNIFAVGSFGDFGAGIALNGYIIEKTQMNPLKKDNYKMIANELLVEAGPTFTLEKSGGLISYELDATMLYDFYEHTIFAGASGKFMLSNIFGFEFEFCTYYTKPKIYPWRQDFEFVFSPIIKINY